MININTLHQGDCIEIMKDITDHSIDLILCDLPYGMTQNTWDEIIPLGALWSAYKRIIKSNGVICLTATQPFTSVLVMSNKEDFKYAWVWEKTNITGFLNAKKQPLRCNEDVLVFYSEQSTYNPQFSSGKSYQCWNGNPHSSNYGDQVGHHTTNDGEHYYPRNIIKFDTNSGEGRYHPTEKPVALFEYMIKTYTNPGETVLDNCAGSGTTGVACVKTNRNYILIEKSQEYCSIIERRLSIARDTSYLNDLDNPNNMYKLLDTL